MRKTTTKKTTKKVEKTFTVSVCIGVNEKGDTFVPEQYSPYRKTDIEGILESISYEEGMTPVWIEAVVKKPEPVKPETIKGKESTAPKPKRAKARKTFYGGWD